jgi:hypothetical protein
MRHPRFRSDETAALYAPRTVVLRAHFANRIAFFTHLPADCLTTARDELSCRGSKGLRHRPHSRIGGRDLRLRRARGWNLRLRRLSGYPLRGNGLHRMHRNFDRRGSSWSRFFLWRGSRRRNNLCARSAHTARRDVDRPKQLPPILGHPLARLVSA